MVSPDLTPAVVRALEAAQRLARLLGAAEVQPAHLLGGLLDEQEGRASELLGRAGLSPGAFQRSLDLSNKFPIDPAGPPLPLDTRTRAALDHAREVAGDLSGERTVASEHVVLALVRVDAALREQVVALGLSPDRLEAEAASAQALPLRLDEPLELATPTDQMRTARILDAAANRAREALRVVEDYCRFALDDRLLSGELKQLRHDLVEVLADLPPGTLLEARDTPGDVGTSLTTASEEVRVSLRAVVQANLKRLQEALRSLEEYAKQHGPRLGRALEQLRYRGYTLERAILLGTAARARLAEARLYVLLTGSQCAAGMDWIIAEAGAGGAAVFQLREKNLSDRELLARARKVRTWTRRAGALFILNDRPDLARLAEADGVHLGQDDLPVREARQILGPDALVGVSTHDLDQLRRAVLDGASYVGVGPTFPSGTKQFADLAGPEFVRQATATTTLPAFAIGGINGETIHAAVAAGARRVAVSQAIAAADDPRAAAAGLLHVLQGIEKW